MSRRRRHVVPLDPEDEHRLVAAEDYADEADYLEDDHPTVPFEPGDYITDRPGRW